MSKVTFTRRQVLAAILAAAAIPVVRAQTWPQRPIRLVVPFPPGGLIDNMARLIAPKLSAELGQTIVIDNKPGAGGNVGAAEVSRATPTGYTLLMASTALTISPAIYPKLAYRPEDIEAIGLIGRVPNVLLVKTSSPINSVADLVARAKQNPGKLNYASNGNGTSLHLSSELLNATANIQITHVPYRGAAAAMTALIAGEVDVMFENLPSARAQLSAGTVRAIAVTSRTKAKSLPKVPTMRDELKADFDVSAWFGVASPAGLPAGIKARLETAIEKVCRDPKIAAAMEREGADVAFVKDPALATFISLDAIKWQRVAKAANIKAS
jgi:tripartite-type tricarboxylate transporter receptor subunit TctC